MIKWIGNIVVCLVMGVGAIGCCQNNGGGNVSAVEHGELTAVAARESLKEMAAKSKDEAIKALAGDLDRQAVALEGGESISIGRWRCELGKRTFVTSIESPQLIAQFSGVFELSGGKWRVRVTETTRN